MKNCELFLSFPQFAIDIRPSWLCLRLKFSSGKYLPYADFVIHAAASTNEKKYLNNIQKEINNNKKSLINFCSLLNHKKFAKSSIVYLSSGAVYGNFEKKNQTKEDKKINIKELSKLQSPKKEYAISKLKSEEIFRNTCLKKKIKLIYCKVLCFYRAIPT